MMSAVRSRAVGVVIRGLAIAVAAWSPSARADDRTGATGLAGFVESAKLVGYDDAVYAVAFSPDGKVLAAGGRDRKIILWDVATGKPMATLEGHKQVVGTIAQGVGTIAFSPDGKTLASGSCGLIPAVSFTGEVKLWDVKSGAELATLKGPQQGIYRVAFSPDGKVLAAGGPGEPSPEAASSIPGMITLWDAATRAELGSFKAHDGSVTDLAFSPDNKLLVTAGEDLATKLWDWAAKKEVLTLEGEAGFSAATFSPGGKTLATATFSPDSQIQLWDLATGKKLTSMKNDEKYPARTASLHYSPDGKLLAMVSSANASGLRMWDVETGDKIGDLERSADGIRLNGTSLAFAPDGLTMATGHEGDLHLPASAIGKTFTAGGPQPVLEGDKRGFVRLWRRPPGKAK